MTLIADAAPADPLGLDARPIRRVGPPDAPFAATRASVDGDTVILVDADLMRGWAGWRCAGAQHLLAPLDVRRRADGHDALLPDLREPSARACGAREQAGTGWHRGEAVTLVVSGLRGVAEAAERGLEDEAGGAWWIAVDGRPVFVFAPEAGEGEPIADATRALVRRVAAACDDRIIARVADDVLDALDRPRALGRRIGELEAALFDAAAPQPLVGEPPARAGSSRPARVIGDEPEEEPGILMRVRGALERHVDGRVAALVGDAMRAVGRRGRNRGGRANAGEGARPPAPRPARRRVAVVGLLAAGLVLVVGLAWPHGDGRAVPAERPVRASPADAPPEPERTEDIETMGEGSAGPLGAARELLAQWDACDAPCALAGAVERSGAVADPDRVVSLVDDYGSVALLAVDAPDADRQLLVIERGDGSWRIRDLYRAPAP
ncbi:hypothetical protein [Microbacterium karelineae]|uniref:hypothetical protein n=1 Tax=Microbacterium karelineae TaxID=2654283 RepID=UPI0012EA039A|nr:hypothetical protein [Microbacterium karelineae]